MDSSCSKLSLSPCVPSPSAYKYSRGKLVLCAGSEAYPGAACLSAWASQYAGAGYTQVFTHASNVSLLRAFRPSLVVRAFEDCAFDKEQSKEQDRGQVQRHSCACAVGPGFDAGDIFARNLTIQAITSFEGPLLLDGSALSFACDPYIYRRLCVRAKKNLPIVLTPHAGEAQRLSCRLSASEKLQGNANNHDLQIALALSLSRAYGAVVVLKGENTVIAYEDKFVVITHGTAALAKAGTGDVLAGIIGALLAQGMAVFEAAVLGVCLHADAGIVASKTFGIVSVCAEEVVGALPATIQQALETPHVVTVQHVS